MRRMVQIFLIALSWCLWPASAQAQAFPCNGGSDGAGPGERMVGMSPSGPGMAPFPLCVRVDAPSNGPAGPPASSDTYAAVVWHPDVADVWIDGNYINRGVAETNPLNFCESAMGAGCVSGGEWRNSSMTIIRDKVGNFYRGWSGEGGAERKRVLAECSSRQLLPCEIFATIKSSTPSRTPTEDQRKRYAASAWVVGTDGYDMKLYVATGHRKAESATAAALKACSDATSRPCEINALSGNGFIQAYRVNGTDDSATAETSAKRAKEAAQLNCKKLKATSCDLQALFDSREPGQVVHDFAKGEAR
jgi:hypothetical protein